MVLIALGFLVVLLVATTSVLLSQLRALPRAAEDNLQWSISQIDTEFANLDATLTEQLATQSFSDEDVKLRVNIALSRLNIVTSGRAAEVFADTPDAAPLLANIDDFAQQAIAIVDDPAPLLGPPLAELQQRVRDVRPSVREIALLGIRLGAEMSDARRADFSAQLAWTGGIAIVLLLVLAALMLLLDLLLQRAARRDAALRSSSQHLSATIAASLDAIITANEKGEITGFNASAEQVFGWTRAEIIGQTMQNTLIPHRMREAHANGMDRFLKTGTPRVVDAGRIELAALRKSGEEFPVELNITTTRTARGTTFIAYLRDISEIKINEQNLIDARDRAERADRAKSRFLTTMSHEMRTPLNGILGVLDLLKTTPLDEAQTRYAQIATASSEVLLAHVNEALDITRIETGELQLRPQHFAMSAAMQDLIDVFTPLAQEKNLSLSLDIEAAMRGPYHGDAGRIRQVLTNLIGNAVKFTEQGGITLRVRGIHGPDHASVRFEVIDTGIGIPADQAEHIFEDFFTKGTSIGRQNRGDGLGLSIARRIARAMDGDIALQRTDETGSTFVFSLPLSRASEAEPASRNETDQHADMRPCDILVVEDNVINRGVLGDMLLRMGHTVDYAVDGAAGVERAETKAYDLIFMDISMPVMDGLEATKRLRAGTGPNAASRIIGLTAHNLVDFEQPALAAGMSELQTKPVRLDTLRKMLASVPASRARPSVAPDQPTPQDAPAPQATPGAMREMIEILGPRKVAANAAKFLAALDELNGDLVQTDTTNDTEALAESVHRAKGAAALFGLKTLQESLGALETQARAGEVADLEGWVGRIASETSKTRAVFADALGDAMTTAP